MLVSSISSFFPNNVSKGFFDGSLKVRIVYLTLSQTTNVRLFQTERVADDNFKFDENGIKFSEWLEDTVGKGEIARYERFLKTCTKNK